MQYSPYLFAHWFGLLCICSFLIPSDLSAQNKEEISLNELRGVPGVGDKPIRNEVDITQDNWKKVDIPFKYINNLIVLEVVLDGTFPVQFIFDTGAEHTILTKREFADLLNKQYHRKFTLLGADMKTELYAYLVRDMHLKIGQVIAPNRPILVLENDYYRFDSLTGVDVHGILGADFFRQFVIQIDYDKEKITLNRPSKFKHKFYQKNYETIDMEVYRGKPYIDAKLDMIGASSQPVKLLLDTGAGLPLLLYTKTDSSLMIPTNAIRGNVGRGLGGYLEGYQGRIQSLGISDFMLASVITHFQDPDSIRNERILNDRNGILGNKVLKRFHLVLDYWGEQIYLRPNKQYKTEFKFDRSGLVVVASGKNLNKYTIQYIIPNSPADEIGIQKDDQLVALNGFPSRFFSLPDIVRVLQRKEGKRVRVTILRGEERLKFSFQLRNLI